MSHPPDSTSAMHKALNASAAADLRRLHLAADALKAAMPGHGVIFNRMLERKGCQAVQVLFQWPGVLVLVDPGSGEPMQSVSAADMRAAAPAAAAFVAHKACNKPLKAVTLRPPQGRGLRAGLWADGVVRAYAVDGDELLAESLPGQPYTLRPGFHTLTAQELAPRID